MSSKPMSIKASLTWSFIATLIWCLVSLAFISKEFDRLTLEAPILFVMMFLSMRLGAVISYWINRKWPQHAKKDENDKQQIVKAEIDHDSGRAEHVRRRRESVRTKQKKRRR